MDRAGSFALSRVELLNSDDDGKKLLNLKKKIKEFCSVISVEPALCLFTLASFMSSSISQVLNFLSNSATVTRQMLFYPHEHLRLGSLVQKNLP